MPTTKNDDKLIIVENVLFLGGNPAKVIKYRNE